MAKKLGHIKCMDTNYYHIPDLAQEVEMLLWIVYIFSFTCLCLMLIYIPPVFVYLFGFLCLVPEQSLWSTKSVLNTLINISRFPLKLQVKGESIFEVGNTDYVFNLKTHGHPNRKQCSEF